MSFLLYARKNQLSVQDREPVTSGSQNVYSVRFEFSEDWDEMDKIVSFRFHGQTISTVLDENGACQIPWEVIDHFEPQTQLYAGVCGTKEGTVVLPTVWTSLGTLLEGVTCGRNARPPTPNLYEQMLSHKQDKLHGLPGQIVGFDENGAPAAQDPPDPGAVDHDELTGREKKSQHPIEAITGLTEELERIPEPLTKEELEDILNFDDSGGGTGASGVSDHRLLSNRDADAQHPISAIQGLQEVLDSLPRPMTSMELRQILYK